MPRREPGRKRERYSVFLNVPYDSEFENLYLAYIAGLSAFGLIPRATLEIPTSRRRLERILMLIEECTYSIHDLSRVQLDKNAPRVPRFNMPFELGLAVAHASLHRQTSWYVCETVRHRANKSLSDLDGTDVRIHGGTIRGLFGALWRCVRAQGSTTLRSRDESHLPCLEAKSPEDYETGRREGPVRCTSLSRSYFRSSKRTAEDVARQLASQTGLSRLVSAKGQVIRRK
jgi:hypothetical protein